MTTEIGHAALGIIPSFDGFDRRLEAGTSKGSLIAGKSGGSRFGSAFSTAAKASLVGALGLGVVLAKVVGDSVESASSLNESLNAVTVTYGKQADAVKVLGTEAAESLGLSNTEFNGLAVRFSAFAETVSGGGKGIVTTLDELTTRASDFASVMDLEVNEAAELFQSGLAGETEPLRKFGIDLSAAKVEAFAYAEGIAKAGEELTEGQKVQARYGALMGQTSKTQGDFANTSDDLANTQRRLTANWEDAKAKLGTGLLPILADAANFLNEKGIPAFERAADFFTNEFAPAAKDLAEDLKPVAGALKDVAGFLLDLPSGAKLAALAGVVGGVGALKLRGGGGGLVGGIGAAVGLAKPVPVFVTNPGFGVGGGKTPPIIPGGVPKAVPIGALPKFAPLIPIGLDSAPGQDSLLKTLTGVGLSSNANQELALPDGVRLPAEDKAALEQLLIGPLTAGAEKAAAGAAKAFKAADLPAQLKTNVVLNGVPESRKAARALVAQYDLTPKQKQTAFELLGVERSRDETRQHVENLSKVPKRTETDIRLNGVSTALAQINSVSGALNSLSSLGAQVGDQIRANLNADKNFDKAADRMGK